MSIYDEVFPEIHKKFPRKSKKKLLAKKFCTNLLLALKEMKKAMRKFLFLP
jgi:hypothetical protein